MPGDAERDYSKPVSEEQETVLNEMAVDIINGNKKLARKTLAEFIRRVESCVIGEFDKCVALVGEIPYMDISPATCCDAKLASTIHHVRTLLLEEKDGRDA